MQAEDIMQNMDKIVANAQSLKEGQEQLARIIRQLNAMVDAAMDGLSAIALSQLGDQKPYERAVATLEKMSSARNLQ